MLCVSSLHSKASDDVVRDTLYREYKKYGDISVRVIIEPDERVAYVYFRNFDDAEDALYSKSRIILFDRPAVVEPVFESRSEPRRPRSITPPPSYSRYRSRSPVARGGGDHYYKEYKEYKEYRDDYHHHHHNPKPYYRGHHDYHRGEHHHRGYRGRGNYHGERGRGGYHPRGRGGGGGGGGEGGSRHFEPRGDYKKDKFPNYLVHIQPEDDPLATRTLFAGRDT